MKSTIIALILVVVISGGFYYFLTRDTEPVVVETVPETIVEVVPEAPVIEEIPEEVVRGPIEVIGTSVNGNEITAYHYGTGERELLFVGGIHGGYSWNTVLVAYELMDYLKENPEVIPDTVTVTVIPVLNPDGLDAVVGSTERFTMADVPSSLDATIQGRFNGDNVDLNRNFDCDWQSTGTWQNKTVSGGTEAFSEPEAQAIKTYVEKYTPSAAVVWYSAAGGVFASNCHNGILLETKEIMDLYAGASGYKAYEKFDFYTITGDMVNWLALKNIPAISVLLTTHKDVEWSMNQKGIDALLAHFVE